MGTESELAMHVAAVWDEGQPTHSLESSGMDWTWSICQPVFSSDWQRTHDSFKTAETRASVFVPNLETSSSPTSNSGWMYIGIWEVMGEQIHSFFKYLVSTYEYAKHCVRRGVDGGAGQSYWKTNSNAKWFMLSATRGRGQIVNIWSNHWQQKITTLSQRVADQILIIRERKMSLKVVGTRQHCFSDINLDLMMP